METIVLNIEIDQSKLDALEANLIETAKAAGIAEDEIRSINKGLSDQVKEVTRLRSERERLLTREKELSRLIKQTTDTDEVQAYEKEWSDVRKELEQVTKSLKEVDRNTKQTAKSAEGSVSKLGGALSGVATVLGTIGIVTGITDLISQLGQFGAELADLAPEIEALDKKALTVLGDSFDDVSAAARQNAQAIGLSERQYINAATAAADLLIPMGFQRREAADLSVGITNLSGALSAWDKEQRSSAEIADILNKALLGEREQLKGLGIAISEADVQQRLATKGQKDFTGQALEQAKALATLELITEKSADAQASFAANTETIVQRQGRFAAIIQTIREELAEGLIPALGSGIDFVSGLANSFLNFIRVPTSEKVREQQTEFNTLTNTLIRLKESGDNSIATQELQASIVNKLNNNYKQFLPELIKVTDETDALKVAQDAANRSFERRITLLAQQEAFEEAQRRLIENQKEQLRLEVERQQAIDGTDQKSGTRRALEGIASAIPGISGLATTLTNVNNALNSQVAIEARLSALKQERVGLDNELVILQKKLIQDGDTFASQQEKQEETITKTGLSIARLKREIQDLTEQFENSTDAAERAGLAQQITFKQEQLAQLELLIKPDPKAREKLSKEQERLQQEADRLSAAVVELRAQIAIDTAGGESTIEGLALIEARTIQSLQARKEFALLTETEQQQAITNIQSEFAAKREAIYKKETESRVQAAKKAQDEEQKAFRDTLAAQAQALATASLQDVQLRLIDLQQLQSDFNAGLISQREFNSRVEALEADSIQRQKQLQIEYLRTVAQVTDARIAENQRAIDEINRAQDQGSIGPEQQAVKQSLIEEQETLNANLVSAQRALADAEVDIIKGKNEEILDSEQQTADKRKQIQDSIANSVVQIVGSTAGFFEAAKQRELQAAGNNAEERERIEQEYARKQQQIALAQAAIQGSVAVVRAFSDLGPIAGAIAAIALAATIAAEISNIQAQQFYEGTQYATEDRRNARRLRPNRQKRGRDKIPAYLHEGERVTPAYLNARYFDDLNVIEGGKLRPGVVERVAGISPDLVRSFLDDPEGATLNRIPAKGEIIQINPIREQMIRALEPTPELRVMNRDFTNTVNLQSPGLSIDYTRLAREVAEHGKRAFWGSNSGHLEMLREIQNGNMAVIELLRKISGNG